MSEQVKTLVILSPGFPRDEADSTCIPPQQVFVRNLKRQFPLLNIVVLAFEYPFYTDQYHWNGITVISFGGANKGGPTRLNSWRRAWLTLDRLNKKYQLIGLLSFWMGDCALIADTFARRRKLRHFCWILGQDARPGNRYFRWIRPRPNSLIALSDFILSEVKDNYGITPAHVIPVGVDPLLFDKSPANRDIDVLGAGSLIALKSYTSLVNVVAALKIYFHDLRAVICGEGPERQLLNELISEYNLKDNLELKGELPHTAALALMQRTKVFVHPSSYEGLGMVCLEALYAGAHVVSFVRPMDQPIQNWHFAQTADEMVNIIRQLLDKPFCNPGKLAPHLVADTCKCIMQLFDYKDAAIS